MYLCSNKSCSIMDDKHIHEHIHEHEHEHEHEHCEHCHEHHHEHHHDHEHHHHHHEEEEGHGRLAKIIVATVLLIGAVIIENTPPGRPGSTCSCTSSLIW